MVRIGCKGYFLPNVEIKDYSAMIDERKIFEQPIRKSFEKLEKSITQIATGAGNDYFKGNLKQT